MMVLVVNGKKMIPGPQKHVKSWPSGMFCVVLGHKATYFGHPCTLHFSSLFFVCHVLGAQRVGAPVI